MGMKTVSYSIPVLSVKSDGRMGVNTMMSAATKLTSAKVRVIMSPPGLASCAISLVRNGWANHRGNCRAGEIVIY